MSRLMVLKFRRWLLWPALLVLTAVILNIGSLVFFSFYEKPVTKKADAVIVLGAAINSPVSYRRALEGLKLYNQGKGSVIVLSGGKVIDSDETEAHYMARAILATVEKVTPPLILEENSRNTHENIRNSKVLLPQAKTIIVVSDSFHLARAVFLAKSVGFEEVYWHATPRQSFKNEDELWYYTREFIALFAYLPKFILK